MTSHEHIVVFRFNRPVPASMTDGFLAALRAFPGQIPGILDLSAGLNDTEESENAHGYSLGLRITFESLAALQTYRPHPLHQAFVASLNGLVDHVIVMDYPITPATPTH
ncbi:Dabb family protein [Deinococcus sp.]|uniref:Dabb family protein n=1 Tax=Deinococcus sp. TaxID=47478 RepID=UPI002869B1EF|nr:Dabb family protein [Deinococcus sp.]